MNETDSVAAQFEKNRSHLRAVAYRMLGSLTEADDAVQEAWLKLSRSDASSVENLGGWLTTVVARVCLDMLRARKSRREESFSRFISSSRYSVILSAAKDLHSASITTEGWDTTTTGAHISPRCGPKVSPLTKSNVSDQRKRTALPAPQAHVLG